MWLLTLFVGSVWGGNPLEFQKATDFLVTMNPSLKGEKASAEALKYQANQILSPNSPSLFYNRNNSPEMVGSARGASDSLGVSWSFLFPGKSLSEASSFEYQAKAQIEKARGVEMKLLLSLLKTYALHRLHTLQLAASEKSLHQYDQLNQVIEQKYKLSQISQVDLFSNKAQLSEAKLQVLLHQQNLSKDILEFRSLIKDSENNWVPASDRFDFQDFSIPNENSLCEWAENNNPEILQAHQLQNAGSSRVTRAKMEALPDFTLSASIQTYNEPTAQPIPSVSRDYSFGFSLTFPLFFPFNENQLINKAKKEFLASQFSKDATLVNIRNKVKSLHLHIISLQQFFNSLRTEVLPMHQANLELTSRNYILGRSDYLRLKDARQSYLESQQKNWETQIQIIDALTDLIATVGCDFTQRSPYYVCL